MDSFDRNWRGLQLETLVDLSLTIGGVLSEEELVEELLQRAVGTLDAGSGFVSTLHPGGQEAIVRSEGLPQSVEVVRTFFDPHLLEDLAAGQVVHTQRTTDEPPFELMAAPMLWQQRTVGMVVLADKEIREGRTPFSEGDARLLLSMASMVATAVATARRVQAIERDRQRLADENRALRDVARREGFIGESPQVEEMLELVRRAAPTGCWWKASKSPAASTSPNKSSGSVWLRVARLLHSFSDRSREPFVPLNCAALPETLLESELFGIEEGVATGVQRRHGKIELANGGTLFLDEVADLSLALQAKLLRVVQEREFERLGGRERIPVDIHLVTATNRDLEEMVERGEFRRDLYYRLRVVVVEVPALRSRRADIPLLARHFLELYGERFGRPGLSLSREALAALMTHPFPGNVRELENAIQAAIALAPEETITVDDLRLEVESRQDPSSGGLISLNEVERRHIENVLRAVDGNRQEAARILGIDRTTLYRKLQRFASHDAESIN